MQRTFEALRVEQVEDAKQLTHVVLNRGACSEGRCAAGGRPPDENMRCVCSMNHVCSMPASRQRGCAVFSHRSGAKKQLGAGQAGPCVDIKEWQHVDTILPGAKKTRPVAALRQCSAGPQHQQHQQHPAAIRLLRARHNTRDSGQQPSQPVSSSSQLMSMPTTAARVEDPVDFMRCASSMMTVSQGMDCRPGGQEGRPSAGGRRCKGTELP